MFKVKKLNPIFEVFERINRCYAVEDGDAGAGGGDPEPGVDDMEVSEEDVVDESADESEPNNGDEAVEDPIEDGVSQYAKYDFGYVGSKDLNPTQRPLKIVTDNLSKEEVDSIIAMSDPNDIFMSDEEVEEAIKSKDELQKEESDGSDPEKKAKKAKEEEVDPSDTLGVFLKETGFSKEVVQGLPDAEREKLVDLYISSKGAGSNEEIVKLSKERDTLKQSVESMSVDPIIAARIAEITTGQKYVASSLPELSKEEIDKFQDILDSGDNDAFQKALNGAVQKLAKDAVSIERSVIEKQAEFNALQNKAVDVILEVGKLDSRLKTTKEAIESTPDGDPSEIGQLLSFAKKQHLTLKTIASMDPKILLSMYSAHRGWDREKTKMVADNERKKILDALKNPRKPVAPPLGSGKTKVGSMQGKDVPAEFDRGALISEIAAGKMDRYLALLESAESGGNVGVLDALESAFQTGVSRRQSVSS